MSNHPDVYIFLADGFEDLEALTVVDLLRRAGIDITTVSMQETREVVTSHKVILFADKTFKECDFSDADLLVLPGGMPGTEHLRESVELAEVLRQHYAAGKKIAAICAAPTVLSGLGILKDKKATCYPSSMPDLDCREKSEDKVVVDGTIITSRGVGTAIDFALCLITQLISPQKAREIADSIVFF